MNKNNRKEKWIKIANEFVVSLFPVFSLTDAIYFDYLKKYKISVDLLLKIYNNNLEYYAKKNNWEQCHDTIVNLVKKNHKFLPNIFNEIEIIYKEILKFIKEKSLKLEKYNNKELNKIYQKYLKLNQKMYFYGTTVSFLDFNDTTYFTDTLKNILKNKNLEKYFQIITTPTRETFNKKQERDLVKLYILFNKDKKIKKKIKLLKPDKLFEYLKEENKYLYQTLKKHTKKYTWVNYVYEGPAADEYYFLEAILDMFNQHVDGGKILTKMKKETITIKKKQQKLLNDTIFNINEKYIIKNVSKVVFYKAYRRELQSHSYYLFEPFLKEISKRLNLSIKQIRMMTAKEIEQGLNKNIINSKIINERFKKVIYFIENKKRKCLTGIDADNYLKHNSKPEKIIKKLKELTGTIAYNGKVKGVVKIINSPKQMNKMEVNNILIACTTNPNLMPAIRKAKAIVTDEGGLTCHAAIVSREMNIPCIVGTKIVTQVLKDGDLVEVDAYKGIIKKIK